jgi:Flp pilus assembly pilin Flp
MMDVLQKLYERMCIGAYVKVRGLSKGQSMTEYALILGAVAVAVFATYNLLGGAITTKVAAVNTALAPAA